MRQNICRAVRSIASSSSSSVRKSFTSSNNSFKISGAAASFLSFSQQSNIMNFSSSTAVQAITQEGGKNNNLSGFRNVRSTGLATQVLSLCICSDDGT